MNKRFQTFLKVWSSPVASLLLTSCLQAQSSMRFGSESPAPFRDVSDTMLPEWGVSLPNETTPADGNKRDPDSDNTDNAEGIEESVNESEDDPEEIVKEDPPELMEESDSPSVDSKEIKIPTRNVVSSKLTQELWAKIASQKMGVPETPFKRAHALVLNNPSLVKNKDYLTLISFDQPSVEKRMYVINLNSGLVERHLVAHGKNSGDNLATKFSNKMNSKQSSLGLYLTLREYSGANGKSLRLKGLEETNSNAERRAIVIHGADYVSERFAERRKRLGRSWGCPALDHRETKQVINKIKDGSVLYIFRYGDSKVSN